MKWRRNGKSSEIQHALDNAEHMAVLGVRPCMPDGSDYRCAHIMYSSCWCTREHVHELTSIHLDLKHVTRRKTGTCRPLRIAAVVVIPIVNTLKSIRWTPSTLSGPLLSNGLRAFCAHPRSKSKQTGILPHMKNSWATWTNDCTFQDTPACKRVAETNQKWRLPHRPQTNTMP